MEEKIEITVDSKDTYNALRRMEAYNRFFKIITEKGITPYNISKNTGVATSTLSDWKNGKSMPKSDKMKVITDYIGADENYILTGEEKPDAPAPNLSDEYTEIIDLYSKLSKENQAAIMQIIRNLK